VKSQAVRTFTAPLYMWQRILSTIARPRIVAAPTTVLNASVPIVVVGLNVGAYVRIIRTSDGQVRSCPSRTLTDTYSSCTQVSCRAL